MVVPFGVSVGDFISGLEFIGQLIKALKDSTGSKKDYCDLISELESLERALIQVKNIEVDLALQPQKDEVTKAAVQCQGTVLRFLIHVSKYKHSLATGGSGNRWRDVLRKCQWVFKKEDVQKLRAQIQGHIASIGLGLVTLQINSMSLQPQAQDQDAQSCSSYDTRLGDIGKSVSENTTLLSELLKEFGKSVTDNVEILSTLKDLVPTLQKMISVQETKPWDDFHIMGTKIQDTYQMVSEIRQSLPVQIDRPSFYFLDACGFSATFDLAFFDNWEIFEVAIGAKFKERGLRVVEKKKYVLEDAHGRKGIDRNKPFKHVFLPGCQINMDACFDDTANVDACCPVCRHVEDLAVDEGIDCSKCRTHYRRIEEIVAPAPPKPRQPSFVSRGKRKACELSDKSPTEEEDQISHYRRIRLRSIKIAQRYQVSTAPVHRSHTSRASFSSRPSDSATWSFTPTPVREGSFSDEMAIYSRCPVPGCKSTFTGETLDVRKGNHTRHIKTHSGVRFYCKDCASHYNRVDNLLKHRRENHPTEFALSSRNSKSPLDTRQYLQSNATFNIPSSSSESQPSSGIEYEVDSGSNVAKPSSQQNPSHTYNQFRQRSGLPTGPQTAPQALESIDPLLDTQEYLAHNPGFGSISAHHFKEEDDQFAAGDRLKEVKVTLSPKRSPDRLARPVVSSPSARVSKRTKRKKAQASARDGYLLMNMDPNRPDIARQAARKALDVNSVSGDESMPDADDIEEEDLDTILARKMADKDMEEAKKDQERERLNAWRRADWENQRGLDEAREEEERQAELEKQRQEEAAREKQ